PRMRAGAGTLVSLAGGDGTHQEFDIILARDEFPGQLVQQLSVAGRILVARPIERIDQTGTEEVGPPSVDGRPGEERIVGGRYPVYQSRPGPVILPLRLLAIEKAGLDHLVGAHDLDLAACALHGRFVPPHVLGYIGEERGVFPELLPRPLSERVVV